MTTKDFELLAAMIVCPSVSNNKEAIAGCLTMLTEAFGGTLYAQRLQVAGQPLVLFSSHEEAFSTRFTKAERYPQTGRVT